MTTAGAAGRVPAGQGTIVRAGGGDANEEDWLSIYDVTTRAGVGPWRAFVGY